MFVNRFYKIIFSLIQNNYVFEKVEQNYLSYYNTVTHVEGRSVKSRWQT